MEKPSPTTSNIKTIVKGEPTLEGLPPQIKDIIYSKAAQSGKDYASIRRINRQISKREDIVNIKCTNPPLFLLLDFLVNSKYFNVFTLLVNGKKLVNKKKPASNRKGELVTGNPEETTFELYITIDKISNRKISISIALYGNYFSLYLNKNTIGSIYDQIFSFIDDKEGKIFEDISIYPPPLVWFKLVKDRAGCNQVKVLKYIREFTLLVYKKELKKALDEYRKEMLEENQPIEITMDVDEYVEDELDLIRKLIESSNKEISLPVTIKKWIGVEYKLPISYVLWVLEDVQHTNELLDFLGDKISRNTQFSFVSFEFTRNEYKAPEGLIKDEFYKFYEEKGIEEKYIDTQWEIYLERARKISQSQIRKEDRDMNYPDKNNMTDEELERFYDSIGLTNRTYRDYKKQRYIKNRDNWKKRTEKQVNIDNFILSMPEGLTRKTAGKYVTKNATGYTSNDKIKIINTYLDKTAASKTKSSKEESEENEEEKSEESPTRKSPSAVRRTKKLSPTIEKEEETEPIEMGKEEEQPSEEEIEEDLSRVTEMEKRRARRS